MTAWLLVEYVLGIWVWAIHKHLKDQDVVPILYMKVCLIWRWFIMISNDNDYPEVVPMHLCTDITITVLRVCWSFWSLHESIYNSCDVQFSVNCDDHVKILGFSLNSHKFSRELSRALIESQFPELNVNLKSVCCQIWSWGWFWILGESKLKGGSRDR